MLKDVIERVEKRLRAVNLSASAASKEAGLSGDAIRNMKRAIAEKTKRQGVSTRTITALAPVLQTTTGWLLSGEGEEDAAKHDHAKLVPLVGYVGAGAAAHFFADTFGTEHDHVAPVAGANDTTVAVEIRGDSLGSFFDRWLVFYDDVHRPVSSELIGRLCVVGLADGRVLIKKIKRSRTRGLFHLLSQTEDPILDVEIEWAAKVRSMVPRT